METQVIDTALRQVVRLNDQAIATESNDWRHCANMLESAQTEVIPILPERIIRPNESQPIPHQIWDIVSNKRFRRGQLAALSSYRLEILHQISQFVDTAEPIQLVLPSIPFKDQSSISTGQAVDATDLGEHAMVAQFRDMLDSVGLVYEPGMVIHLVTDGIVYRYMCENAHTSDIARYSANIAQIIGRYGLEDRIQITDFSDLVCDDAGFSTEHHAVMAVLEPRVDAGDEFMVCLQRSMLTNMWNEGLDMPSTIALRHLPVDAWPEVVRVRTGRAACDFAGFLITAMHRQVLSRAFPLSIRATVHPKDAPQLPINLVNRRSNLLPYNGVPVIDEGDITLRNSLRIVRLATVLGTNRDYIRHNDQAGNSLYYEMIGI